MRRLALLLAAFGVAGAAHAIGSTAEVDVVDSASGQTLPVYHHGGHYYVAGEPGHEYSIRIANRESGRILAVASVDGINVISGETASPAQSGYILDPYQNYDILGWRKNLDGVASFYFTSLPDSYAARTGRARDVGVIGVALFREKYVQPVVSDMGGMSADRPEAAPSAPAPLAAQASSSAAEQKADSRLGTGHGRRQESVVTNGEFERASDTPAEIVAIYYDSRRNLIAQGIIRAPSPHYPPNPFPNAFVPDP